MAAPGQGANFRMPMSLPANMDLSGMDPGIVRLWSIIGEPTRMPPTNNSLMFQGHLFGVGTQKRAWRDRYTYWEGDNPVLDLWVHNSIIENDNAIASILEFENRVSLAATGKYTQVGMRVQWLYHRSEPGVISVSAPRGLAQQVRNQIVCDYAHAQHHKMTVILPIDFPDQPQAEIAWRNEMMSVGASLALTIVFELLTVMMKTAHVNNYRGRMLNAAGQNMPFPIEDLVSEIAKDHGETFACQKNGAGEKGEIQKLRSKLIRRDPARNPDIHIIKGPWSEASDMLNPLNNQHYNKAPTPFPEFSEPENEPTFVEPVYGSKVHTAGEYPVKGAPQNPLASQWFARRLMINFPYTDGTSRDVRIIDIKNSCDADLALMLFIEHCGFFPTSRSAHLADFPTPDGLNLQKSLIDLDPLLRQQNEASKNQAQGALMLMGPPGPSSYLDDRSEVARSTNLSAEALALIDDKLEEVALQFLEAPPLVLQKLYGIYHKFIVENAGNGFARKEMLVDVLPTGADLPYSSYNDFRVQGQKVETGHLILRRDAEVGPTRAQLPSLSREQRAVFARPNYEAFLNALGGPETKADDALFERVAANASLFTGWYEGADSLNHRLRLAMNTRQGPITFKPSDVAVVGYSPNDSNPPDEEGDKSMRLEQIKRLLRYVPLVYPYFKLMAVNKFHISLGFVCSSLLHMTAEAMLGIVKSRETGFHYLVDTKMLKASDITDETVQFLVDLTYVPAIQLPENVQGRMRAYCGGRLNGGGVAFFKPDVHGKSYGTTMDSFFAADFLVMVCRPDEKPQCNMISNRGQMDKYLLAKEKNTPSFSRSTQAVYNKMYRLDRYLDGNHPFSLAQALCPSPMVDMAFQTRQWARNANGVFEQTHTGSDICGPKFDANSCGWFNGHLPIFGHQFANPGSVFANPS